MSTQTTTTSRPGSHQHSAKEEGGCCGGHAHAPDSEHREEGCGGHDHEHKPAEQGGCGGDHTAASD